MTFLHARAVQDAPDLTRAQRAVLMAVALRADRQGDAWPSIRRVAENTGYGERWVRQIIRELVETGHLRVIHRTGRSSALHITSPALSARDPGTQFQIGHPILSSSEVCKEGAAQNFVPAAPVEKPGVPSGAAAPAGVRWVPQYGPLGDPDCRRCKGDGWEDVEVPRPGVRKCPCREVPRAR